MRLFITKILKFLIIPLVLVAILTIGYLVNDPFKVLRPYPDYSFSNVILNRDHVSTEVFLKNIESQKYNSFIFGSSRTMAFRPSSWKSFLPPQASPFSFDAHAESVYGIYNKIKFLDSLKVPLRNVLIILCRDASFANDANHKGHLFIKDPKVSGDNKLKFHLEFYKAYFNPYFLISFYSYKLIGKYKPFMKDYMEERQMSYNNITNEIIVKDQEAEILENKALYYSKKGAMFYKRETERTDSVERINKKHLYMLNSIKNILEKNGTSYKIVLSPLYEQIKFNATDLRTLQSIFGNRLYDFSGKNAFTEDKTNYYELMHYRPLVGDSIFSLIYGDKSH